MVINPWYFFPKDTCTVAPRDKERTKEKAETKRKYAAKEKTQTKKHKNKRKMMPNWKCCTTRG